MAHSTKKTRLTTQAVRYDSDEANRLAKAFVRKQVEADVAAGVRPASSLSRESKLAIMLEREKANGGAPPDMTVDQLIKVRERIASPRSGKVPVPLDYRDEKAIRADKAKLMDMRRRSEVGAESFCAEILAKESRWRAEKPEYERRLVECEKMNDICEAAARKLTAPRSEQAKMSKHELQVAFSQVYEIAITGHLKGVSEKMLGSQEATVQNYEYHFGQIRRQGMRPKIPDDYKVLKHYENERCGRVQDSPLPINVEWTAAQREARFAAEMKRAQARAQAQAGSPAAQQPGPSAGRPVQQVYQGESGVPMDINHVNRQRVVPASRDSRDTSDMKVEAASAASPDMQGDYY